VVASLRRFFGHCSDVFLGVRVDFDPAGFGTKQDKVFLILSKNHQRHHRGHADDAKYPQSFFWSVVGLMVLGFCCFRRSADLFLASLNFGILERTGFHHSVLFMPVIRAMQRVHYASGQPERTNNKHGAHELR
jgi:hypothetical protein